jgi:predicted anti-sigma-YlaC factor YlaD
MSRRNAPEVSLHPTQEDLMSFLDGELDEQQTASVRHHLVGCVECSRTLQQFAAVTSRFSDEILAAGMDFTARLRPELSPSLREQPRRKVRTHSARWAFAPPRSAAASIAIVLVGTLAAHLLLSPRPVSARGLVDTASQRQQEFRQTHPTQVLERNLRVTKTVSGKAVGTEHWTSHLSPQASYEELVSAGESALEIQGVLPEVACRRFVPLSLEMLDCLLDAEPASIQVRERDSEDGASRFVIELASLRNDSPPLETRWTLRTADWQLSTVEYRTVRDQRETVYRIEEESANLVPLPRPAIELSKAIELTRMVPQPTLPARLPVTVVDESDSGEARRPGIRLRVFEAIDAFNPALDEDLQLAEDPTGVTTVSGIVPNADRKAQLESLLSAQAGVRSAVLTQSEAIAEAFSLPRAQPPSDTALPNDRETPDTLPGSAIRSQDPLLAAELDARFGSHAEGNAQALRFGAAVLEETQHLAFRARWLARLENAFSASDWHAMSPGERERFLALRAKWRQALQSRHQALRQWVNEILCPVSCLDPAAGDAPAATLEWQSALDAELALLKTMFVDGAFAPAGTAQQAKSRWSHISQATSQALQNSQPWQPGSLVSASSGPAAKRP